LSKQDIVCAQVQVNICQEIGAQLGNVRLCGHVRVMVVTSRETKATILWNQQVQTDRNIPNNKPDIIICGNVKGTCLSILTYLLTK